MQYVLGYGSLASAESFSKVLKRNIRQNDLIKTYISGYKRTWRVGEKIKIDGGSKSVTGVFLDVASDEDTALNGLSLKVSDKELEELKLREKNYRLLTVESDEIRTELPEDLPLVTFQSLPEHRVKPSESNALIPLRYYSMVAEAYASYGVEFLEDYFASTEFPQDNHWVKGEYVFQSEDVEDRS